MTLTWKNDSHIFIILFLYNVFPCNMTLFPFPPLDCHEERSGSGFCPVQFSNQSLWSYRLGEAPVLWAALHVEGFDLGREAAEQDGLVDGVGHQPLRSFRDVLRKTQNETLKLSPKSRQIWLYNITKSDSNVKVHFYLLARKIINWFTVETTAPSAGTSYNCNLHLKNLSLQFSANVTDSL